MSTDISFSDKMLVELAKDLRSKAYAPYSNYTVGAACLGLSGIAYFGCNVENSSYPVSICAERSAIASAVAHGEKGIVVLAVAGGPASSPPLPDLRPCGMCLQFMAEFMKPEGRILIAEGNDKYLEFTLKELFPEAFNLPR